MRAAVFGHIDDFTAEQLDQSRVFTLWVYNEDFIVLRKIVIQNHELCQHGFT